MPEGLKPLEDARAEVLEGVERLAAASVPLSCALGLVLAEDIIAPDDVPPFANSAVDGYAVRAQDIVGAPVTLVVVEDVAAGHVATRPVAEGTAIKIMTGAPIPVGADAVVKVEDVLAEGSMVRIDVPEPSGTAVRPAGGDVTRGETVFRRGTILRPAHVGVLASLGMVNPVVFRRPRVAVISTGDEVVPPETSMLEPGAIRDSNRPLLLALLSEVGVEIDDRGIVPDDADLLRSVLVDAASANDAVLTSGGVSMGDYDLVKRILTEVGNVELWKVAMQPAKPFAYGKIGGTPLFGLPGNPVSVYVAFEQFVRPALLTMMGVRLRHRPRLIAILGETVETDPGKTVFLRVRLERSEDRYVAWLSGGQSSNVLSAAANAEGVAVVGRGIGKMEAGSDVTVEVWNWPAEEEPS